MKKENPGRYVFGLGIFALLFQFIGIVTATPPEAVPASAAGVGLITTLGITVFISSVVGAYYAGKRRSNND